DSADFDWAGRDSVDSPLPITAPAPTGTAVLSERNMLGSPAPSPYGSPASGVTPAGTAGEAASVRGQRRQRPVLATATSSRGPAPAAAGRGHGGGRGGAGERVCPGRCGGGGGGAPPADAQVVLEEVQQSLCVDEQPYVAEQVHQAREARAERREPKRGDEPKD